MPARPTAPVNYIFVDFENVHEVDLSVFDEKTVHFTLLVGAQKSKLDAELVEKLLEHSDSVNFVKLTKTGNNALDFVLAYYVGRAATTDPNSLYFHIISKDKGYDPLVDHLRTRNIQARRHDDFARLKQCWAAAEKAELNAHHALIPQTLDLLRNSANNRPKKVDTLFNRLKAQFGKDHPDRHIKKLIEEMTAQGFLVLDENKRISYDLKKA